MWQWRSLRGPDPDGMVRLPDSVRDGSGAGAGEYGSGGGDRSGYRGMEASGQKSEDLAAGAVLIGAVTAAAAGCVIFIPHFL